MNSMASPSALHAGPLGCACFSWCDKAQITAFLDGLPSSVTSRDAPWYQYAKRIYNAEPSIPLDVTTFGFFTLPWGLKGMKMRHRWKIPQLLQPPASDSSLYLPRRPP